PREGLRSLGFAMAALVAADRAARPAEERAELPRVRVRGQATDEPGFEGIRPGGAPLGLPRVPRALATQQAAASVGQGLLIARYAAAFTAHDIRTGQVLLS